jgi:alkanesulfonate monooxygenase SsuD/methylene tetrahydromethanopterin reductase-like flavin-dependent oxidoreductase (luciferase family)
MTIDSGPDFSPEAAKKAYRSRVGFVADSPNFPNEWDSVVEKVKIADELGFDSVWLGESWGYELFTSMADLVRATKRIKIGAGAHARLACQYCCYTR